MLARQLSVKEIKNYLGYSRSNKLRLSDFQLFSQALSWSVKMPASFQLAFARAELQQ